MVDDGDGAGGFCDAKCEEYKKQLLLKKKDKNKDKDNGTIISGVPSGSCSGPGCILESGIPAGPGCIYTNYCYVVPEEPEPLPWAPDYFVLDVGGGLIGILGVDVQPIVFDKYGRFYFGIGPGVGTSPAFGWKVNGSWSGGYILDSNTTEGEVKSFLSKWTVTGCGGFAAGVCGAWGDPGLTKSNGELKDLAIQVGAFTPQLGVSATYGIPLSDR